MPSSAEDGIRDWSVTGVQTCALPIDRKSTRLNSSRRRHTRLVSDWSSDVCSSDRSEEHTSELQSLTNLVCRLLLGKKEHTSELQSLTNLVCRLLLEKKERLRSEEHTSELQSLTNLVCRLLLGKKNQGHSHHGMDQTPGLKYLLKCLRAACIIKGVFGIILYFFFFLKIGPPPEFSPFSFPAAFPI